MLTTQQIADATGLSVRSLFRWRAGEAGEAKQRLYCLLARMDVEKIKAKGRPCDKKKK